MLCAAAGLPQHDSRLPPSTPAAHPGRDAVSGYMQVRVNTPLWGGPGNQAPIGEAAVRDVLTLMTALQQQL